MPLPGWETVAGVGAEIIHKLLDRKGKVDAQIRSLEEKIKSITGVPGRERDYARFVDRLSKLRAERARLK